MVRQRCGHQVSFSSEEHRPKYEPLGEGFEEKGEHAVAGDVGERGEFEGVMAAVEREGTRRGGGLITVPLTPDVAAGSLSVGTRRRKSWHRAVSSRAACRRPRSAR